MTDTLFDVPPPYDAGIAPLLDAWVGWRLDNVRPDDEENARRAAARVRAGRKAACAEVYAMLMERWPDPVSGTVIVSRFLGKMRDPERRLRELRTAMHEAGMSWRLVNDDGWWRIEKAD